MRNFGKTRLNELKEDYNERTKVLKNNPETIQDYDLLNSRLETTVKFEKDMKEEICRISEIVEIIEEFFYNSGLHELNNVYILPFNIMENYRNGQQVLEAKKVEFGQVLVNKRNHLKNKIKDLAVFFEKIRQLKTFKIDFNDNFNKIIKKFKEILLEAIEEKDNSIRDMKILYPERAKAFDDGEEDYPEYDVLDNLKKEFTFYNKLWEYYNESSKKYEHLINKSNLNELIINVNPQNPLLETFEYITYVLIF